jgi:hypothetical protein
MVRTKVIDCIAEMCRAPAQCLFRSAVLNNKSVFKKVLKYLLAAIDLKVDKIIKTYLQLFLAICLGPESGVKGFVTRTRRAVYIPGETQEQRRLKKKAI